MAKWIRNLLVALISWGYAQVVVASPVVPVTSEVVPGTWCSDFKAAKGYADANNVPLLVFWASKGCSSCEKLEEGVLTEEFKAWQAQRRLVMVYVMDDDEVKVWVRNPSLQFPYMAVYWNKNTAGAEVLERFTGRSGKMKDYGAVRSTAVEQQLMDAVDFILPDWDPNRAPSYAGGYFAMSNAPSARLEAEVTTTFVRVPLLRDAVVSASVATNKLAVAYPGGSTTVLEIEWKAGETVNDSACVQIPAGTFTAKGQTIGLTLQDADGEPLETSEITYVAECENSPKNPLWIGERTSDTLAFGEWTMDLEVAQEKVAETEGESFTLVLIGGSMWCPDCVKTDAYLIDRPEFKTWAATHRVACVAVDVPKMGKDTPSLLTYETVSVSDRYVTSTEPRQDRLQSGAGYLSRKMVSATAAAAVAARNHHLLYDSTLEGGLCRPEKMQNTFKTGIPCLILLRKDGSIAGRLDQFNDVSPAKFNPAHIDRLNELVKAADDPDEEANADWASTPRTIASSGMASATLSAMDLSDVYKITGYQIGYSQRYTVSGSAAESATDAEMSILRVVGGTASVIKTATGSLKDGFFVQATLPDAADYYVQVKALATSNQFSIDRSGDSTVSYTLVGETKPNPGLIAFVNEGQTLIEKNGSCVVEVERRDGINGACTIAVAVDKALTTADSSRYSFETTTLSWADGETGKKSVVFSAVPNPVFEGRQDVVLELLPVAGAPCAADISEDVHTVTILDNDTPCFGKGEYVVQTYIGIDGADSFELYNLKGGKVSFKTLSGRLPSGVSLEYDGETAVLSGIPKKAGLYEASYAVKDGRTVGDETSSFMVIVSDPTEMNPFVLRKFTMTVPLYADDADSSLAGVLTFTSTAKGAITAKYVGTEAGTRTFKGNWTRLDSETGRAETTLESRYGTVRLTLDPDGTLATAVEGLNSWFGSASLTGEAKVMPEEDAGDFDGYYNVTMPVKAETPILVSAGTGSFALTVTDGKAKFKGLMANGKSFSGSSVLTYLSEDSACCVVFDRSGKDVVACSMVLKRFASETCEDIERLQVISAVAGRGSYWLERSTTIMALTPVEVYGGYYLKERAPSEVCGIFGINPQLQLKFSTAALAPSGFGGIVYLPSALLHATDKGFTIDSKDELVSFKYVQRTGAFSGTAKLTYGNGSVVKGKFSGVLLPGWFGQCDECGEPVPGGRVTRPFASGTFWFDEKTDGRSVRRSMPVDIDAYVAD